MTDAAAVQAQLASRNTDQVLQRIFAGHITGQPGMGSTPLIATIVKATSDFDATVTIGGFDSSGQATFTCYYEPRYNSSHTRIRPPAGTTCIVCFPPNDANGIGWIVMFRGWP